MTLLNTEQIYVQFHQDEFVSRTVYSFPLIDCDDKITGVYVSPRQIHICSCSLGSETSVICCKCKSGPEKLGNLACFGQNK